MTWWIAALAGLAVLVLPGRPGRPPAGAATEAPGDGDPAAAGTAEPLTLAAVAEAADLLAVALSGGAALLGALDVVAEALGGRAGEQLRVVSAAMRWGLPVGEAWGLAPAAWGPVASAFRVAERAGVPPSGVLVQAAAALREEQAQGAALRAAELSARIALPLGLTFLPGFVLTTVLPVVLALARALTAAG
ncbi:type II secretion system F family protein [Arsenicicoccus dermatophilus]|uniref:type II secretion system F family protein n=1 Tax=Arsenicicoccus dermatophilus TaxID=1076331 RepID=UPI001F4D1054|nr:type II secretion system F family protein [Arsenicicoccus dermatophilus]MCH8613951.1 type II secretion system F family protein [Arsenicicoccus dermatophilus]